MLHCQLPLPNVMICNKNTAANWRIFQEVYTDFAMVTEQTNKDNEIPNEKKKLSPRE